MSDLDYNETDQSKRVRNVSELLDNGNWYGGNRGLANMADYMLFTNDSKTTKTERNRKYPIQSRNRKVTTDKRETSLDALAESLADSPISIYDMMDNQHSSFLDARTAITDEDLTKYPEIKQCVDVLEALDRQFKGATGKRKYDLRKQMIETWQQMYLIRASKNPARCLVHAKDMAKMALPEHVEFDEEMMPVSDGMVSLMNPAHVSFLLEYYTSLRDEVRDDPHCDMWCLLLDLNDVVMATFPEPSELRSILLLKMLGFTNEEIDDRVSAEWGSHHTRQYYSMVWRQRIPKMVARKAQERYIWWYWKQPQNHMMWKKCSKCGQLKPAHQLFFNRNNSKSGFYSRCKECGHKC